MPDRAAKKRKSLQDRFWEKVAVGAASACWNWTGSCFRSGYGQFRLGKTMARAHRVSYWLHCGEIPEGMLVLHHCNNRACVSPAHLFLGSQRDNVQDMIRKGRDALSRRPADRQPTAKIGFEDARLIRRDAATGQYTRVELARKFGVSRQTIGAVLRNERWICHGLARVLRRNMPGPATRVVFCFVAGE